MGPVGDSRAFAIFAATGAIGLAAHVIVEAPTWWSVFRIGSGICVAGCYTVVEAWLQAKVTNENRGRAMGTYRNVDMGSSLIAQHKSSAGYRRRKLPSWLMHRAPVFLLGACLAAVEKTNSLWSLAGLGVKTAQIA